MAQRSSTRHDDIFGQPQSELVKFLIVMAAFAGAVFLAIAFYLLRQLFRYIRVAIAVRRLHLPIVAYPPEGVADEEGTANTTCVICITEFAAGEEVAALHCGHIFHPDCINRGIRIDPRCPQCRVMLV